MDSVSNPGAAPYPQFLCTMLCISLRKELAYKHFSCGSKRRLFVEQKKQADVAEFF
jgi:hypothetical protein